MIIYVLQLASDKYYIGKTNKIDFRLEQHFNANGSVWTKMYKPIKVVKLVDNCDSYDEDKITLMYMNKYGIGNVRGGSFCEKTLSSDTILHISKMLNTANDGCYNCGDTGHFINECKNEQETQQTYYKFEYKSYQQKTYEHCINKLIIDEQIITKISEHDTYAGQYRVYYLTNLGNIIHGIFIKDDIRVQVSHTNNNLPYTERVIKNISKLQFKSTHISKLTQEVIAYVDLLNSIE